MWWECSECGSPLERPRAPVACPTCGTAGVIFVPAEFDDLAGGEADTGGLRAVWLRAGLNHPDALGNE